MPKEYTLIASKDRNEQEYLTIYLTDGQIDMVSDTISVIHDSTHPIVASFMEAIGIKTQLYVNIDNQVYDIPRQAGILNEVLVGGITFQVISKYQRIIRRKVINSLISEKNTSVLAISKKEIELIKTTSLKYLKESLKNNSTKSDLRLIESENKTEEELLNAQLILIYPNLEIDFQVLVKIFRMSRILGRKILHTEKETVDKWNKIAERHEEWFNNSSEIQDFKVRSKVRTLKNAQYYELIVVKINNLINQLPSYLVN